MAGGYGGGFETLVGFLRRWSLRILFLHLKEELGGLSGV